MKVRKIIAFALALITTVSILAFDFHLEADAMGGVQAKLNEVMKEFPPVKSEGDKNTVYFTVSGKPSESISSDDCFYPAVASAHGYNWNNMWNAYSCCGFVHFVFRYVFGVEFTWEDSVTSKVLTLDKKKGESDRINQLDSFFKTCKIGDAILFRRPSTHYVIFLGYDEDAQRVSTYDCGWDRECAVKTLNRSLNGMKNYDSVTLYHANNYDRIDTRYGVEPILEYNKLDEKTIEITGCSEDVEEITVPEKIDGYTVTRIAQNAFSGTSLERITLPKTLTSIGENALEDTPLYYNSMSDGTVYIENCLLYTNSYDEEFTVRYGTSVIADKAFQSDYIKTVVISEQTKYISDTAFDYSNVTEIKSYKDTEAQRYADEHGYNFVLIESGEEPFSQSLGDVSGDERISVTDAKWILQSVSGIKTLDKIQHASADVNKDGKISVIDAKWILQSVAGTREIK